jgi:hypothetical protein
LLPELDFIAGTGQSTRKGERGRNQEIQAMQPSERTILDMNTWPNLIEVNMKPYDSCACGRETADLLRWSMGAKPRHGRHYVDYAAPTDRARPAAAGTAANRRRFLGLVRLKMRATLRLWAHHLHQRCRTLGLRSCMPPTYDR